MFTSMKPVMLLVSARTILLDSSVKVSQPQSLVYQRKCEHKNWVTEKFLPKMCEHKKWVIKSISMGAIKPLKNFQIFSKNICGISSISPVLFSKNRKRIVGGMEVVPHSWPWQVSFQAPGEKLSATL